MISVYEDAPMACSKVSVPPVFSLVRNFLRSTDLLEALPGLSGALPFQYSPFVRLK